MEYQTHPLPRIVLIEGLVSPPAQANAFVVNLKLVPRHAVGRAEKHLELRHLSVLGYLLPVDERADVEGSEDGGVNAQLAGAIQIPASAEDDEVDTVAHIGDVVLLGRLAREIRLNLP